MPTTPYAALRIRIDGGALQEGGVELGTLDDTVSVQLAAVSIVGWDSRTRWEITGFPPDWDPPTGWTLDEDAGVIFYQGISPPAFDIEAASVIWGKWLFRLLVNGGGSAELQDTSGAISTLSPSGLEDVGTNEENQFDLTRQSFGGLQRSLRTMQTVLGSTDSRLEAVDVRKGDLVEKRTGLMFDPVEDRYVKATATNLEGILGTVLGITVEDAFPDGFDDEDDDTIVQVRIADRGRLDPDITALDPDDDGRRIPVRLNPTTALLERCVDGDDFVGLTPADCGVGVAFADGSVVISLDLQNPNRRGATSLFIQDFGAPLDGTLSDLAGCEAILQAASALGVVGLNRVTVNMQADALVLDDTLEISDDVAGGSLRNVCIFGGVGAPSTGPYGMTPIKFTAPAKKFTAQVVTIEAFEQDETLTTDEGTRRRTLAFLKLTGAAITALSPSASWKGRGVYIPASTYAPMVGHVKIVAADSTSITISHFGAHGLVPGSATISLWVKQPALRVAGREVLCHGFQFNPTGASVFPYALIETTEATGEDSNILTNNHFKTISAFAENSAHMLHLFDIGVEMVPLPASSKYKESSDGYPVPYCPPNQSEFIFEEINLYDGGFADTGYAFVCSNYTAQARNHKMVRCSALPNTTGLVYVEAPAPNIPEPIFGSYQFEAHEPSGGGNTGVFFVIGNAQVPIEIYSPRFEAPSKILAFNRSPSTSKQVINIHGGLIAPFGYGPFPSPQFELDSCVLNIYGTSLITNENASSAANYFSFKGYRPELNLFGVRLPGSNWLGGGYQFHYGSVQAGEGAVVGLFGCSQLDQATNNTLRIKNGTRRFTASLNLPLVDEPGQYLAGTTGISATDVEEKNFAKRLIIPSGKTSATWKLENVELDENFSPKASVCRVSSGAAAGSNRIRSVERNKSLVKVTLEADPGGTGQTVEVDVMMVRHSSTSSTSYPTDIPDCLFWFKADMGVDADESDPSDRILETWESQAFGAFVPLLYPSATKEPAVVAVDAGYNNGATIQYSGADGDRGMLASGLPATAVSGLTVFLVGEPGGSPADNMHAISGYETGSLRWDVYVSLATGNICAYRGSEFDSGLTWTGKEVVCVEFNGASTKVYRSKKTTPASGSTTAIAALEDRLCLGGYLNPAFGQWGGTSGTGKLFEACGFGRILSTDERNAIFDLLGASSGKVIAA